MRYLLHQLLEQSAALYPDRLAVIDQTRLATYAELDARANQLANLFQEHGIGKGERIGLYLEKSLEAVIGIYGILKAGAAYVPLDPRAPTTRLGYIAGNCELHWLVSAAGQSAKWSALIEAGAPITDIVTLDEAPEGFGDVRGRGPDDVDSRPTEPPAVEMIDQDLAYILYTSGSTGQPKGVMLSHRNGLAFVHWTMDELGITPEDRLSSHAPFHFDLSIFDLFAAAGSGASVSLVPPATSVFPTEVGRFIDDHRISIWYSVPSILSLLTQHGNLAVGSLKSLRAIVFAGEVFPSKYLAQLMELLPDVEFHNWYGPTETNVCTAYPVSSRPDPLGPDIPIGRAIANVHTFVVREDGQPARPGEEGELYVRGATVMQGYWGDPEKTASRLVSYPFDANVVDPCYRTGDLVIETSGGDYQFLGRRDHQIKSRGYRIELGEVETAMNANPKVVECAVVAIPDEIISNRIVAHVVVSGERNQNELVAWCAERIPRYMIPESFLFADELPKTSTGKIDRQAIVSAGGQSRLSPT
jgi:amino acid adenylation domain-containing protein